MPRTLPSPADQQLWAAYAQTVRPLHGRQRPLPPEPPNTATKPRPRRAPSGPDQATAQKFAAGKLRPARRLDLHGLTAARAHHAVTSFIEQAHAEQTRCIEIITGKGEVLARELPHWLNAPHLRPKILALVHPHAANTGALRILLRRIV